MGSLKNTFFNKYSSIFIVSFSHYEKGTRLPANGQIDPLLAFFLKRTKTLLLLDQPHVISDTIDPIIEIYNQGRIKKKFKVSKLLYLPIYFFCSLPSGEKTRLSYKLRDFLSVIFVALTQKDKYDLFIGLEGVNTLAGIILKKVGLFKTVIYYVSDYSPARYKNTLFNSLYLWLDRFCVKNADFTWDVSPAMQEARLKLGFDQIYSKKVIHVPNGLFPNQIKSLSISERAQGALVYLGILELDMGPDLAVLAMTEVVKKVPNATLQIIGGKKEDVERLKKMVTKLKLENNVTLYGFIDDRNKMSNIVKNCMVGLAPYRMFKDSIRWYGDAGKIRQYLACGLPVVTTPVPPLGRYVAEKGAALMVQDTVADFSQGIIKLLLDKELYKKMSEKAKELSKENTWENTYLQAFKKMEDLV